MRPQPAAGMAARGFSTPIGVLKGRRITVGDLVLVSRLKAALQRRRALAAVAACVAASEDWSEHSEPRREVERACGKWRGSPIGDYLRGDDITYKANFRMDSKLLGVLVDHLKGSALDRQMTAPVVTLRVGGARPAASGHARIASAAIAKDPPSLRFKLATCLYTIAQGGPLKQSADSASIGESTLRRWLSHFCMAVCVSLRPIYMPGRQFTSAERAAVQSQFASRRGIRNVTLACDGTHLPFHPR